MKCGAANLAVEGSIVPSHENQNLSTSPPNLKQEKNAMLIVNREQLMHPCEDKLAIKDRGFRVSRGGKFFGRKRWLVEEEQESTVVFTML